ncbi:MAG: FAD-dependent oxidoreductase [Sphingomonadaceae bacterium]|nr:FAD-dependent oxidoreductase [Sphingomonadaceae bacterium]
MEQIADDLSTMRRTPLLPEHVEAMRAIGKVKQYPKGTYLTNIGDPTDRFVYIEQGEVEVVDPFGEERLLPSTLGPTQFMGEVSFLNGGAATMKMRAAQDTQTLEVERTAMLDLMSKIPEMSDIVISVLTARRRRQVESEDASLILIGADKDPAIQRIASFASRNKIPFVSHDLDSAEAKDSARSCKIDTMQPAVIFGKGRYIESPTPQKVAEVLGLRQTIPEGLVADLLIVGGGPAGVAAAVYAGAEGIKALVIDELAIGGQAGTSSRIENYMGFPTGISGADLVWRGQVQAMKFGTCFSVPSRATALEKQDDGSFCVTLDDGQIVCARAILIAAGVQYQRLPLDRLDYYEGAGVYYAATDMEARFCRNTDAAIIGGGNSAGQAAMFLSRSARHVHVLVRGDSLAESMSDYLRSRLEADEKITIHYGCKVSELHGESGLTHITLDERGDCSTIEVGALFVMVGAAPNTGWLSGLVDLDGKGFVKCGGEGAPSPFATSHPGIYAVGDVRAGSVKRVASAVGEGSVVISEIWRYLDT